MLLGYSGEADPDQNVTLDNDDPEAVAKGDSVAWCSDDKKDWAKENYITRKLKRSLSYGRQCQLGGFPNLVVK